MELHQSAAIVELAGDIVFNIGAWKHFGYDNPPAPDSAPVPPLGERNATAITAGHDAIHKIDELVSQLFNVRAQLVSELREDEDIRAARVDKLLSE